MGAFHGAPACEVVGLFILSKLVILPNFQAILYRDDGLGITSSTPRQTEKLRQAITKVFKDNNLNITIEVGLVKVNFLDVTLDLNNGTHKPFRKPGDKPRYVSSWSNHPPAGKYRLQLFDPFSQHKQANFKGKSISTINCENLQLKMPPIYDLKFFQFK